MLYLWYVLKQNCCHTNKHDIREKKQRYIVPYQSLSSYIQQKRGLLLYLWYVLQTKLLPYQQQWHKWEEITYTCSDIWLFNALIWPYLNRKGVFYYTFGMYFKQNYWETNKNDISNKEKKTKIYCGSKREELESGHCKNSRRKLVRTER